MFCKTYWFSIDTDLVDLTENTFFCHTLNTNGNRAIFRNSTANMNWFAAGSSKKTKVEANKIGRKSIAGIQPRIVNEGLDRYLDTRDPMSGPTAVDQSGNGGVMRLAPVVLAYGSCEELTIEVACAQSRLTHASPPCLQAASDMARFLRQGDRNLLSKPEHPPSEATGWIKNTMHAVHWALRQGSEFDAVLLAAVNLGGDADTVGAVTGQMAGRIWGYESIPAHLLEVLHDHSEILHLTDRLCDLSPMQGKLD